jgi:hypothetical protein
VTVCCFVYILYVHNSFQFLKYIVRTLNWVRFYCWMWVKRYKLCQF